MFDGCRSVFHWQNGDYPAVSRLVENDPKTQMANGIFRT